MQDELTRAIEAALLECGISEVDFVVEHPADPTHGDYATNAALVGAKAAGMNPRELGEQLVSTLTAHTPNYVADITIAGPGFINITLSREFFTTTTTRVLKEKEAWGRNTNWSSKRVLVEYTDPNPFKEFHIGHLFTNTVGESIARLFEVGGALVQRCNYQGDVGMHVAYAVWGMREMEAANNKKITNASELGQAYAYGVKQAKEKEEVQEQVKAINRKIYEGTDTITKELYSRGREISLSYFEEIYSVVGTKFDHYFYESEASTPGRELVVSHPEIFPESDGAKVFEGEKYGLHTRVFVNSEGLPTYEAKELALAKLKEARVGGYDHSVISTANEINEYFKVLLCAMEKIYPELAEKTEHIGHGMVRLASGKMSSRTGDVIPALDFIHEIRDGALEKMKRSGVTDDEHTAMHVAIGAIKYATLKSNILQDSVFDKEKALSFEGDSGPYLQYTNARINSVLEKADCEGITPHSSSAPSEPFEIERLLYRWPEVTQAALSERAPHLIARYLTDLAGAFNTFYATEKIADASDKYAPYKAAVAKAVGQTLKNGLWVLGIEAPEKM